MDVIWKNSFCSCGGVLTQIEVDDAAVPAVDGVNRVQAARNTLPSGLAYLGTSAALDIETEKREKMVF